MSANNHIEWRGLAELRAELRRLPATLVEEATGTVQLAARNAEQTIAEVYRNSAVTGNLLAGLRLEAATQTGRAGVLTILRSRSPHAWMFEHGSQARHTAFGANRGVMPATPIAIPTIIRERRHMYETLARMLARVTGFQVTGRA